MGVRREESVGPVGEEGESGGGSREWRAWSNSRNETGRGEEDWHKDWHKGGAPLVA